MTRTLTRHEKRRDAWQAAMREAWLRDHPDKTPDDYEIAGSCTDTDEGERAYHEWYVEWLKREGAAIRQRVFGSAKAAKKADAPKKSWRDVLPVHKACELFPMMSEAELRELGEDIKKNGLKSDIVLFVERDKEARKQNEAPKLYVLDGRNRLAAMELVGADEFNSIMDALTRDRGRGRWYCPSHCECVYETEFIIDDNYDPDAGDPDDPYAYVISANIHRRHLSADQKRDLIAKVLKAKPEQSNAQVAAQVKADDKTVAKVRKELESTSEIPKLEKTVGKDGKARKQPAKRKHVVSPEKHAATLAGIAEGRIGDECLIRALEQEQLAEQKVFDSPQEAHAVTVPKHSINEKGGLSLPDRLEPKFPLILETLGYAWREVETHAQAGTKTTLKAALKRMLKDTSAALAKLRE
jgi:hypothetical protein